MILKNSAILGFFAGISLILGIIRDRLLAQIVGVGPMLDVYNASFRVPDLILAILLSLASATTVVPFLTHAVHTQDRREVEKRFNTLFFFFGGCMLVFGFIIVVMLPFLAQYIVPGFNEEQIRLYVLATRIFMIQPLLLGLSTLISSLAQVRHQFVIYSISPLLYTAAIIASVALYPTYGFVSLITGVVLGAAFHLGLQSYTLRKQQLFLSPKQFDWSLMKQHLLFAAPRSGSYMISRIRDLVFASVATTIGIGALSIYIFAQRIVDAYMQLVVQSLSTATLPKLALHHAKGETNESSHLIKKSIIVIALLSTITTSIIVLLRDPLLAILYGRSAPLLAIGHLLVFLSIGMPILAVNYYLTSTFNASRNNVPIFISNFVGTGVAIGALLYMREHGYGIESLGIASIITSVVVVLMYSYFYSRKSRLSTSS